MFIGRWLALSSLTMVILLGMAAFHPAVVKAVGFQPVSPEELKMTSEPLAPGAPAIILYRQVDRDDNGRTSHEDNYMRIKILNEEGRKYADIEIPFLKGGDDVVKVHARTIRPDGSIAEFDGKIFDKSIMKARGLKYLAKTFTLPDVQPGSIIEYYFTYDFREYALYESHWILSQDLFTKTAKFSLKPYQGSFQNPFAVRWTWHDLPAGIEQPKEGPDHFVRLEAHNIPAFQTEDFMPPENELKSRVDFIYSDEPFESNMDKYWKKIGKRRNDSLEGFTGKRKTMEQAVAEIVLPNDPPELKLQKIYTRVQKFRNTSFELHKTEQETKREKEKNLDNVEAVWKQGYGDGWQLTWLYLALVRAAGIEAYGMWVSDRRNYFFSPQTMDSTKLDSNVVLVKVNGKDIFCDPGAAFTPFGLLPWQETGVRGLRLDKDGGTWVQTMLPESSASRIERRADLKISDTGDLEGKVTVTFTGLEAAQRRIEERHEDEAARRKFLEDGLKESIPAAVEVDLSNQPDWNSSETPLVAEFKVKVPGWVAGAGRRALASVGLFSAPEKRLFDHANRVHPIYFEFPFQRVDDLSIELPEGWQVSSLPPAQNQEGHVVTYKLKVENDKNKLHVARSLTVDLLLLDSKYYTALRNFFR